MPRAKGAERRNKIVATEAAAARNFLPDLSGRSCRLRGGFSLVFVYVEGYADGVVIL